MVLLLAVACGVAVGDVYFPQAISPAVATGLHVTPAAAAAIVTAVQFGYTAGLFLLVPLGDRVPHRRLLVTLLLLTGGLLLAGSLAPALPALVGISLLVGVATVVAPIIGPMVAGLVEPSRRGVTSGLLLSGSTGGMLLSRTFSGYLAGWWGWRAPYLLFGGLILALAVVLWRALPVLEPAPGPVPEPAAGSAARSAAGSAARSAAGSAARSAAGSAAGSAVGVAYPALLVEPLRLLRREPLLRRSCLYQATIFGGFSATWTCVALLLTGPHYGYGARAVGLLALVNAATMVVTPIAGRLVDRHGSDPVNLVCSTAVLVAAGLLALGSGRGQLGWLIAGTLILDVAMQSGMVANQVRFYTLLPGKLSRLNTAYMTCAYLGGALGSWLGVRCYTAYGWGGVCGLVALLAIGALGLPLFQRASSVTRDSRTTVTRI
jgi:predicted MFS family arabinose efflux permease